MHSLKHITEKETGERHTVKWHHVSKLTLETIWEVCQIDWWKENSWRN